MYEVLPDNFSFEVNLMATGCARQILEIQRLLDVRRTGVAGDLEIFGDVWDESAALEVYLWVDVISAEEVVARPFRIGDPFTTFGEYRQAIHEADASAILVAHALTLERARHDLLRSVDQTLDMFDECCHLGLVD